MYFYKNNNWPELDDQQLLTLYKSEGDTDLLAALYSRYIDLLYAVCLKYCKVREQAQDAVLQVFEELPGKLKKHDPQYFRGWIYTVVKNHCLMELRRDKNHRVVTIDPSLMQFGDDQHPESVVEKEFHLNEMTKCIETLSAEQRKSIELFYLQEKCYKEIVSITGLDFNKVRSLIQNGKRNLKICMDKKIAQ